MTPFTPRIDGRFSARSLAALALLTAAAIIPAGLQAQTPSGAAGTPPVAVVTPISQPDATPRATPASTPVPVPESGTNESFSFQKATDAEGTYMVYPTTGGDPVRVSESFLGLVLKSPQLDNQQRAQVLNSYPNMVQKQFEAVTNEMYPDAATAGDQQPFEPVVVGTPGSPTGSATIEADPDAPGYLRVSLAGADGAVEEFSVSRTGMERLLNNPSQGDLEKLQALKNFPFKLPEEARKNYKNLSREELLELVKQSPEMSRQEFVKMMAFNRPPSADETTGSAAETTETAEATPSPTPEPTPEATPEPTPEATPVTAEVETPAATPETGDAGQPAATAEAKEPGGLSTPVIAAIVVVVLGLLGALAVGMRKKQ